MIRPRLLCHFFLIVMAAHVLPADAALVLSISAVTKHTPKPGAKAPPDSERQIQVMLGDTYISATTGNETAVYDFAQRRRFSLDAKSKTYADYSLYDVVGFRELELRNREGLDKALAAMKTGQKSAGLVEHEHELSVQRSAENPITTSMEGGARIFSNNGTILLREDGKTNPASPGDVERFAKFLRYHFGGHPAILSELAKEQGIPKHLTYAFHSMISDSTVEITVKEVREVQAAPVFSAAGYTARPADASEPLDAIVDRAWLNASPRNPEQQRQSVEAMRTAFAQHRPYEAFLSMMEMQLSGEPLATLGDEQKRELQADPLVVQLSRALAPHDKDAMRQAVASLQSLQGQSAGKRHMLKLYEANDRVALGDYTAAAALFVDVLQANPAIAGAYKDIGDFYYLRFDTARAWRCWDIGRRLAPGFGNLQAVSNFEQALAKQFPEYF